MPLAPTSKLEAVNLMLRAVGESPVSSLTGVTTADVNAAISILDETCREVQAPGLHCNTEYNYLLSIDNDGNINLPSNTLKVDVDPSQANAAMDVVARGTRLYDKKNHTYVFTSDLRVVIALYLDFTELPEAVRWYIAVRGARKLHDRLLGDGNQHMYTAQDELAAKVLMMEAESENADYTIFDNWTVGRIVDRNNSYYW